MNNITQLLRSIAFVTCLLFSCKPKEKDNASVPSAEAESYLPAIELENKVFTYAPEMDITNCEALAQCDCCAGNLLFVNSTHFVKIDYCEGDRVYRTGTYSIENQTVTLQINSSVIEQRINREETGSSGSGNFELTETQAEPSVITLTQLQCEKNLAFNTGVEETPFATWNKEYQYNEIVSEMKENGVWSRLKVDL